MKSAHFYLVLVCYTLNNTQTMIKIQFKMFHFNIFNRVLHDHTAVPCTKFNDPILNFETFISLACRRQAFRKTFFRVSWEYETWRLEQNVWLSLYIIYCNKTHRLLLIQIWNLKSHRCYLTSKRIHDIYYILPSKLGNKYL